MYIVCIVCRPDRSHAIEDGVAAASSIYTLGCGVFIQLWKDRKVSHMNTQLITYHSVTHYLRFVNLGMSFHLGPNLQKNTRSNCPSTFHSK